MGRLIHDAVLTRHSVLTVPPTLSHLNFFMFSVIHRTERTSSNKNARVAQAKYWMPKGLKLLSLLWGLWGMSETDWATLTTAATQATLALFADRALIYIYRALNKLHGQTNLSFPTFQSIWLVLWPGTTIHACHSQLSDVLLNVFYCSVISLFFF